MKHEARGQHGWGRRGWAKKDRAGGASMSEGEARAGKDRTGGGHEQGRTGQGELNGCIMHRVHTSLK